MRVIATGGGTRQLCGMKSPMCVPVRPRQTRNFPAGRRFCYLVAGKVKTNLGLEFAQRCDKADLTARAAVLYGCGICVCGGVGAGSGLLVACE